VKKKWGPAGRPPTPEEPGARPGLGRVVASHRRSPTSYQIREEIRYLVLSVSDTIMRPDPRRGSRGSRRLLRSARLRSWR
jgi:hypothetical protein